MNTHDSRSRLRRPYLSQLLIMLAVALVLVSGFAAGTAPSSAMEGAAGSNIQRPQGMPGPFGKDIEKEFNDDDLKVKDQKPRGKWAFGIGVDKNQFDDASLPVAIGGLQSLSGGGKFAGVFKIKRLEIKNQEPEGPQLGATQVGDNPPR